MRAMYNVALCYSVGEGLAQSHRQARKWMKRAADRGHTKAQFEHGLGLFSVCNIFIFLSMFGYLGHVCMNLCLKHNEL